MAQKALLVATLATTNTAQDSSSANIEGKDQHSLYLEWVPGVSGNVLTVKIFTKENATGTASQWTQDQIWSLSSGTDTKTLKQLQETATGTTVVPMRYDFALQGEFVKITYVESDTGGVTKGTLKAVLFSRQS